MPQTVKSILFLYADDSCLMYQHRDIEEIEKQLNKDFENVCDCFIDNKLSTCLGKDKIKSYLFAKKSKTALVGACLGCVLYETLSGEPTVLSIEQNKWETKIYLP